MLISRVSYCGKTATHYDLADIIPGIFFHPEVSYPVIPAYASIHTCRHVQMTVMVAIYYSRRRINLFYTSELVPSCANTQFEVFLHIVRKTNNFIFLHTGSRQRAFFFILNLTSTFQLLDRQWCQVSSLLRPGTCLLFLSRIGFSIHTARRMLLTDALALSANRFVHKKVPTYELIRVCTRGDSNSRN